MYLTDTYNILPTLYFRKFSELKRQENLDNFLINKGNTGQFLEQLLGLPNGSSLTDFVDGELKTNKSDSSGKPLETMFITQISKDFDQLFFTPFDINTNRLFTKISNLLYLPVCKVDTNPENWYFLPAYHIDVLNNKKLLTQLQNDFEVIKQKILYDLEYSTDGYIHTSNGKYIQIRSKDTKRTNGQYNPIYSQYLQRMVSNKNHAFYFKKEFMQDIQNGTIHAKKIV